MEIIPAIDLKDGKVVRLTKGIMKSAKIYSEEPWALAHKFEELGSKWLHVVDLNGAFVGEPKNLKQIEQIRKNCSLKVQIGGGIRDEESIKRYIDIGIDRVILGSVALRYPEFVEKMAQKYKIIVGIDAIGGYVVVNGWADKSQTKADTLAARFRNIGVEGIICTDVSRDGTLSGANIDFTEKIAKASGILTIASGGVKDMVDIEILAKSSYINGVIVGKAFYEGKIDLKEAFSLVKSMN